MAASAGAAGPRFGAEIAPRGHASAAVTGAGVSLEALLDVGIAVDCAAGGCATGAGALASGEIAALCRLVPLGDGALSADALVGGDANVRIEASLAHEGLPAAGGASEVIVRLRGGEAPPVPPPLRIHLVIDASTSMEVRWDAVKDAAIALVGTLRADDELEIVVYGTGARVALPPTRVGDGTQARAVIRGLEVGGRTNIEAGLRAAYADAAPAGGSIVLLLSDGVPQGGAASSRELSAITEQAWSERGTSTVAVGLGFDFDAEVLRAIAEAGHGSFRIAPRVSELPELLSAEITAHGRVVARDLAVEVALGADVALDAEAAAAIGVAVEDGRAQIRVPALSAGAELTFALPVVVGRGAVGAEIATVSAAWTSAASSRGTGTKTLRVARASGAVPAGSMRVALDLELSTTLELAAEAVAGGEGERAAQLLEAHAAEVEGLLAVHADAALRERASASRAMAWALRAHVPGASWPARRATAAGILAWSVGLGR